MKAGTSNFENRIYGMLGQGGSGKTTLLKHFLALELLNLAPDRDVLFFLPNDFLDSSRNLANLLLKKIITRNDFGTYLYEQIQNKKLSIFIDEIEMFKFTDDFDFVFRFARNYETNIYYVAKRTADINKIIVAQSHKLFIFKHTEENDLNRLKKINTRLYEEVAKLNKLEAYEIEDRQIKAKRKIKFNFDTLHKIIETKLKELDLTRGFVFKNEGNLQIDVNLKNKKEEELILDW